MPQATIRDVAREAEVSVASVSRVLNGHDNVRPALRLKVEEVAARLGYVPHAGARSLSLSRTGTIGVVLPDLHGEFYSELLRGMDQAVSARGLHLLLSVMHDRAGGIQALHAMRGRVDGLVVMAPQVDPDRLFAHLPSATPTVLLNCAPHHERRAELRIDNAAGASAMIDHLVAGGRRRIVHIAGPVGNIDADERRLGAQAAAARAGVEFRVLPGDFREASGIAAATTLLPAIDGVDAIFAANDMMAIGALVTLKRAGVVVPEQVAIAGFDDVPLARLVTPALTTLGIDIAGLGDRAVARLATLIAGGEGDDDTEHRAPILIVRDTTSTISPNNRAQQGKLS